MTYGICVIEDCPEPERTYGWCIYHYQRWWRTGDPLGSLAMPKPPKPEGPCEVETCDEPRRSPYAKWCESHYYRVRRTGELRPEVPLRVKQFGPRPCSAPDCTTVIPNGTYCHKHYARNYRHGDPTVVNKAEPMFGPDNPSWRGDDVSYLGAHLRVVRLRGPASAHPCVDCGGPAEDWSYTHGSPNERIQEGGVADGLAYSPDPDDYRARCRSDHRRYDGVKGKDPWKKR